MRSRGEVAKETEDTHRNKPREPLRQSDACIDVSGSADRVEDTTNFSCPLVRQPRLLDAEHAHTQQDQQRHCSFRSPTGAIMQPNENASFVKIDEHSGTSGPLSTSTRCRCLGPLSSSGTSHRAMGNACTSASNVPDLSPLGKGLASPAIHCTRVSTTGVDSLVNSMSAEQNPPDSNQRTFMDDNGILHSEQREDPVAASVRRTLRLVSRKNTIFVVSLVVLILVLTAAGGVSVAFVNKYYTTQSHREYMLAQNRVVLNSSVLMLQMYQRDLQAGAADLMKFMRASPASGHYQNVSALRDALKEPFLAAWRTWLLSSSITTTHSIFVPFCEESEINSGSCPIMALSIACLPYDMSRLCTFESSNDDGLQTSMYEITFRHGVPVISSFKGYGTINVGYRPSQTDSDRGFYLDPSYAAGVDSSEHPLLMLRRQEYLSFGDDTNRIVMCDSGSFLEQWFYRYEKSLQKSSDSYSVLFRDNGTILAYGYGDGAFMDSSDPVPCRFYTQDDASRQCGDSKAGVLDKIVDVFEASFPASEVLSSDTANNTFTLTKQMDEYSVAYQDFMRFRTDDANDIVFFAAYATRINSTLGRDGILQIVICVIIIFLCMFILGGVALVSMTQMMKVVQVISQLATHAAMYDTNKMREVLDQQNPGYLARTITSAATINDEFRRILANLNAYRPFLPQSLLAKGNFDFSEEGTDRAALTRKNSAFPNDSRDALDGENRHHYHRHHELRGAELFSPIADHEQRHILSNPIENRRLLQRGFHRTKSTVLVASLSNVAMDAADSVDVINKFVETVLEHAAHANGVVEAIEYQKIVVSFNSHFHVPRHQEKACLCALGMRESLQNSGCNVTIGISTGYNYVGTTGTEQQKARVMVGESVVVAHALATLQHILGCSIFASEAVVHEALVTTVMVDVVQLYYEYNHEWKQYNVSEIIGSRASVLSADMLLVKSVFALVRYRQAEAALLAVRAYVKESQDNNRPLPWPVQRLHALVEAQQTLIKNGYHRERRQWQSLEGVEVIANHLAEVNMLLVKQQQRQRHPLAISSNVTSGSFVCASQTGATTATDVAANTNDGFTRQDETQIARALMGEQSKATAAKRLVRPAQEVAHSEEDTMFAIFVPNNDDEESGDDTAAEEEEQNRSLPNTPATKAKPSERDAAVKADLPLSPLPPPAEQSRFSTPAMVATTAAAAYPSPSAPLSVEVEPALSVSGRLPSPAVQTHHAPLVHPVLTGLQSPTGGSSSVEGGTNRPNTDGSVYGGSGHGRAASFIDDGQLVCADSAWKGSADGSMGSSPHLRQHSSFELPQRIVSVEGQVFYRTSHQIGRGSFGAVYLVISETGYLGAMKTIPLNQSNASQLIHEVETLSQMRHENIVGYDCCAVQDEYFFIICEYMSAGTLGKLIQSLTSIPERAVRKYARDVLFGLCYLHQHSLVHCDIKPENILMLSDGTCKLADFGAASLSRSFAEATTMRGTARFSAPEAIMGVCSKAGDVYSFGITLAQMVTGVHPWHAYRESDAFFVVRYLGEIRHTLETGEPCAMQPDLPTSLEDKELETVIHCCCEFDPKKRPTVEELLSMLS